VSAPLAPPCGCCFVLVVGSRGAAPASTDPSDRCRRCAFRPAAGGECLGGLRRSLRALLGDGRRSAGDGLRDGPVEPVSDA